IEVDRARAERRKAQGFLDEIATDLDAALATAERHRAAGTPRSIAVVANAATVLPDLVRRGVRVDVVTDQTSAHDPLDGYVPAGVDPALRERDPEAYVRASRESIARHCEAIVAMQKSGAVAFDYGNNLRGEAQTAGFADAFAYPGFVPAYIRPLFAEGRGPFRWVALSGNATDIHRTDRLVTEMFPKDETLVRWIRLARDRVPFQGLPARVCWLGYGERAEFGLRIDELVRSGEISAPIVIGRDHLDSGSVASPFRETEGMRDGSDAIADWPILNALVNTSAGATWVSVHHGGGVGIGNSLHAGMVAIADGSTLGHEKLARVLTTDPGTGVMRHADAGYPEALEVARDRGVDLPST
ncbi:MAG: urocanate hydratase, partial [Chloroflexota bacterium]|nr:urocanate hydratase [Chloroflexota bacterium]